MNEIKLSGVLGKVEEYTAPSGPFLTASLEFTQEHDARFATWVKTGRERER